MQSQTIITLLIVGIVISKTLIGVLIYFLIRKNRLLKVEQLKLTTANSILSEQAIRIHHYNEELKIAESFKTKVLSIASHDLRAPFASVEILLAIDDISLVDKEDLKLIFLNLKGQVARSRTMLEEVLLWTESQLRDKLENTENCNICAQIDAVLGIYTLEIQRFNIQIINSVSQDFWVDTHKGIFAFVLRNVISNAIKYGRVGGTITLQLIDDRSDRWELIVSNDGEELTSEVLHNLNFVNSWDRKKSESKNGAGLGISLCKDLIKRIDGKMQFENQHGTGISVRISFPRKAYQAVS
ncbi:HAMP domain-containing sensor histidine kinase [Sphingobacterium sp. 18053]|uniref:sensor histidine kinase n=1 Tax=Sphingobacterium sp. 18053 TaxID=2681401 RepID=UPI0013593F84|nr:HAMP domain-containing sensor histidine kinase [Sphingobacterium sp. 18053]